MTDRRPEASTAVFEQYEEIMEDTAKLTDRRQTVNNLYLSANSLLLGAIALLTQQSGITSVFPLLLVVLIAIVGAVLCFDWRRLVETYRRLVKLRITILKELEDSDSFKAAGYLPLYHREDELFAPPGKDGKVVDGERGALFGFSRIERNLPVTFTAIYVLVVGGAIALHWDVIINQLVTWGALSK